MVLRAGIIIPFQYGGIKKLLMVGSPNENRDLKPFDFTNVVRAAFNIYNFEFRNKKIDFLIPEDLLIRYLEQCNDLTNFVIQIDQAVINAARETTTNFESIRKLSFEPSSSQQKSNSYVDISVNTESSQIMRSSYSTCPTILPRGNDDLGSPLDVTSNSDHSMSNNAENLYKQRRIQFSIDRMPESLIQSIDPNDVMPKTEQEEAEMLNVTNKLRLESQQQIEPTHQAVSFFPHYSHAILGINATMGQLEAQAQQTQEHPQPSVTTAMDHTIQLQQPVHRFRRRGERMSKDQKELYVKFFEDNPCMLQQRRNDAALAPLWNKLANMLNNVQQGAVKNVEEWKQTFDAWRYRVFMYSRYNSKLDVLTGHNMEPHCETCHCSIRHDVFGHNSLFNYEMIPRKGSICNSAPKDKSETTERLFHLKNHTDCDGSHKNLKARKLSNDDDNDSYDRSTPKIRVSNNLLEQKNTITPPEHPLTISHVQSETHSQQQSQPQVVHVPPQHSLTNNIESKVPMETASPNDVKSLHTNTMIIDDRFDDSDSNDSLSDRMHDDTIAKSTYNQSPASNDYYVQRQTVQLTQHQMQQIYDEPAQHYEQQYNQYSALYLQNEENAMQRQRKERMSKRQKELYVEFLEQNPVVNKHRRNDPLLDIFWLRLTNILNSCPNGAAKSVAEWKQAFDNWRYRIFLYARHNTKLNSDDGLDSKAIKPLTRTDKRAYNLWIRNPDTAPANTEKLPNDLLGLED